MKTLKAKLVGDVPVIFHNNQTSDPLNKYSLAMKPLTAKKNKTEDDQNAIARMEWEAGLYMDGGKVVIPSDNILKTLENGAMLSKGGKNVKRAATTDMNFYTLEYPSAVKNIPSDSKLPTRELDRLYDAGNYLRCPVKVMRNTVIRTRPMFSEWAIDVVFWYDERMIDGETLLGYLTDAGKYVGLCDWRPRYGRFTVEK